MVVGNKEFLLGLEMSKFWFEDVWKISIGRWRSGF